MLNQNTDFDLIRLVLMLLVNALEAEQRQRNINEEILQQLDKLEDL